MSKLICTGFKKTWNPISWPYINSHLTRVKDRQEESGVYSNLRNDGHPSIPCDGLVTCNAPNWLTALNYGFISTSITQLSNYTMQMIKWSKAVIYCWTSGRWIIICLPGHKVKGIQMDSGTSQVFDAYSAKKMMDKIVFICPLIYPFGEWVRDTWIFAW